MTQRRTRSLAALGLLTVLALLWGLLSVMNAGDGTDRAASPQATDISTAAPGDPMPQWSAPVPPAQVAVQPEVSAAVASGATAPVIVRLAVNLSGTDADRVAQVRAARDQFVAGLPAGSWTDLQDTGTLPFVALSVDGAGIDAIRASGLVTTITQDEELLLPTAEVERSPSLGTSSIDSTATMGAVPAWAAGWKGAGSTVAIVDTGVQTNHPFLMRGTTPKTIAEACFASPCSSGSTMSVTDAPRVGSGNPCTSAVSGCTHGTHVAGIAAGGTGSSVPSGVAPDADLISINVFSEYLSGTTKSIGASTSSINTALDWLYYNRARFPGLTSVNMSLGGSTKYTAACDSFSSTKAYIDQLLTIGVSTVIAAGNSGWSDGVASPACISTAVTVGAVDGVPDQATYYSNDGPQLDLMAPGSSITSSIVASQMGSMSGTSMAAPAVAGAFAALRQATPAQTLARLRATGYMVQASAFSVPSVRLSSAAAVYPGPVQSITTSTDTGRATISWQPPTSSGSTPVSGYSVTSVTDGARCATTTRSCTISGLIDGASYRFVIRAESATGVGAQAQTSSVTVTPAPTITTSSTTTSTTTTIAPQTTTTIAPPTTTTIAPSTPPPASGATFTPIAPSRLADTRGPAEGAATIDGLSLGTGRLGAGEIETVPVIGRAGIPSTGVGAVALNVTAVDPTIAGHLTVFPTGASAPNASNLNFVPGQTVPNMVIAKLGIDGTVSVRNANGSVHVVVDVVGWLPVSGGFGPLDPARLLDTRNGASTIDGRLQASGRMGPFSPIALDPLGRGGVPMTGVSAVVLNVTVVDPSASGHLTVYESSSSRPNASNLNFTPGRTVANLVVTKVDPSGTVLFANQSSDSIDLVVDVVGWFGPTANFTPIVPARLLESRPLPTIDGREQNVGAISGGATLSFAVAGRGGVPASGARVVVLNVTAVAPSTAGHLTVFASGTISPYTSNLNFVPGQVVPNLVLAQVGLDGRVSIRNNAGSTPVVVDVVGWFS